MVDTAIFFNGWDPILRTMISGFCTYLTMVIILRISGKRTLSQMTPFDMVIPFTLGPILASTVLLSNITILQGLFAFGFLIFLHKILALLSVRFSQVRKLVEPEPTLLLHQGVFLKDAMHKEHVTEVEILKALRTHGFSSIKEAEAVILEGDGSYNVIRRSSSEKPFSQENIGGGSDRA